MNLDRLSVARSSPMAVVSTIIRKQMRDRAKLAYAPLPPARFEPEPTRTRWKAKPSADDIVPGDRFLSMKELCHKVGMGKSTVYRWIDEGRFPPGIELAPQIVRWRESVIDAWMASFSSGAPSKAR